MRASHGPVDTWLQRRIGKVVVGLGIDNFTWAKRLIVLGHVITLGAVIMLVFILSWIPQIMYSLLAVGLGFSLLGDLRLVVDINNIKHQMEEERQLSLKDVKLFYRVIRSRKADLLLVFLFAMSCIGNNSQPAVWLAVAFGFLVQAIALHLATSWDSGRTWRERIKEKLSSIQFLPSLKPAVA